MVQCRGDNIRDMILYDVLSVQQVLISDTVLLRLLGQDSNSSSLTFPLAFSSFVSAHVYNILLYNILLRLS